MPYGTIAVDRITGTNGNSISPESSVFRNRIINGAMTIDQRNAGASVTFNDGVYSVDRWRAYGSQTSKLTSQQLSSAPPVGFNYYMGITSSSAYSVGAGDYFGVGQTIEGFNIGDLGWGTANAKTVTLSFQVYSSLTGTFGGVLRKGDASLTYPFTYSIPTANTWTTISVTIAGPTTGTWTANNSAGVTVIFGLGVGSTYSGTAGAWAGSNYISATGATSVVGTNGATFYITGVQLEVGSSATGFEYRLYNQELLACQRYYQYIGGNQGTYTLLAVGNLFNGTTAYGGGFLRTTMRSAPTFAITGTAGTDFKYQTNSDGDLAPSAIANDNSRSDSYTLAVTVSGRTSGQAFRLFNVTTTGSITFSAEL